MQLTFCIFCHQNHSIAFNATHLPRSKIYNNGYLFANYIFWGKVKRNTTNNRPCLEA